MNRLHVAVPKASQELRQPHIPEGVLARRAAGYTKPDTIRKLERDLELEMGDDYILDLKKHYDLPNPEDKFVMFLVEIYSVVEPRPSTLNMKIISIRIL
jgi:nucleolar GTP-binding protein